MADRTRRADSVAPLDAALSIRRNVLSRIRLGHVVMVLAALLAFLFNLAVLRNNQATIEIAVAVTDISAGTTLTVSHLGFAEVPADDVLSARFLPAESRADAAGQLTTRAISAGEPILQSDLMVVENRGGLRAMSVPIDQTKAVSGRLAVGDAVDVVLVVDGTATYIATDVQVLGLPDAETNDLGARTAYAPTVAVTATEALRIAAALDTGTVHLVRSTGSALPEIDQATAIEQAGVEGSTG